jgi:signal transduction histidine kinase
MNRQEIAVCGRLLLVEDDAGLSVLLSGLLKEAGYACAISHSGGQALELLRAGEFDLALLDYALPDMRAPEVVAAARALGRMPSFVALTGNGDERIAVELMKLGARDYLVKDASLLHRLPNVVARVLEDLTTRRQLDEKLAQAQAELLQASRLAGMAEVATSVLHNVGNVLNSINVSISLVSDQVKQSRIANLGRAAAMLREHSANLAAFLAHDPKGRMLPEYLGQLAQCLIQEQAALVKELGCLRKNVEHIRDVVATQQSYAKVNGATENVHAAELVEEALRINLGSLQRHEVQLIRDYEPEHLPTVAVARHKVLQILVNLIQNAKQACDQSGHADKRITLRVRNGGETLKISVVDNGVGIDPENLGRIFTRGFTTRKDGHGFGLHSSLLTARELGGRLCVKSQGLGQGATFTLDLPASRSLRS